MTSEHVWYCVTCGIRRPPNPGLNCPRPRCNTRSYASYPPDHPRLPPEPDTSGKEY